MRHAAATIAHTTDPHPTRPDGWPIRWGEQVDVRIITLDGGNSVSDAMVAGYLAKYSTKGTEVTGHTSRRLDQTSIRLYANRAGTHAERLVDAAWTLGEPDDWARRAAGREDLAHEHAHGGTQPQATAA
ncbi:MAG: plasmid replication initiator protein [Actinomycetia bacterium]|nr:plasmid replication initiator protein [Actinomycetes bacterium]